MYGHDVAADADMARAAMREEGDDRRNRRRGMSELQILEDEHGHRFEILHGGERVAIIRADRLGNSMMPDMSSTHIGFGDHELYTGQITQRGIVQRDGATDDREEECDNCKSTKTTVRFVTEVEDGLKWLRVVLSKEFVSKFGENDALSVSGERLRDTWGFDVDENGTHRKSWARAYTADAALPYMKAAIIEDVKAALKHLKAKEPKQTAVPVPEIGDCVEVEV